MIKKLLYLSILSLTPLPLIAMEGVDLPQDRDKKNTKPSEISGSAVILVQRALQEGDLNDPNIFPMQAKNPKYQSLYYLGNSYLDFCMQNEEKFKASSYYDAQQEWPWLANIEAAEVLVSKIVALDSGQKTIDELLRECLWLRLDLINRRAISFRETKKHYEQYGVPPKCYYIPCDPRKISRLQEDFEKGNKGLFRDIQIAQESMDRYQFINLIIYHLWKLADPSTLSRRTKEYISCSRTLWPILLDQTTDLSFADFAVLTQHDDSEELQNHKDYDYFWANYDLQNFPITMMNWCRKEVSVQISRIDIISMVDQRRVDQAGWSNALPLPRPSWLYPEAQVNSDLTLVVTPEPVAENHPSVIKLSGEGLQELQNDDKSKHKSARGKRASRAKASIRARNRKQKNRFPSSEQTTQERAEEDQLTSEQPNIVYAASASESIRNTPEEPNALSDSEINDDSDGVTVGHARDAARDTESEISSTPPMDLKPLRPRGMRVFHPKSMTDEVMRLIEDSDPLKGKKLKLIETIFDYHMHGQGFNFGEFKSLWDGINGVGSVRRSGSGSSHYALLNRAGKVVGGTFAHGDGQEYTKSTVRYLRAALNALGIFENRA